MIKKLQAMKNKKGFTLVELIVVLVILAILAALLVPALTSYIDKANEDKLIAECRMVVMAAQTTVSESYGMGKDVVKDNDSKTAALKQIATLAEAQTSWIYSITVGKGGENSTVSNYVSSILFTDATGKVCKYSKTSMTAAGTYEMVSDAAPTARAIA